MEDDLNFSGKWKTTSTFLKMEDDLNFFRKMEENLDLKLFLANGGRPQFLGKGKTTSTYLENGRRPQFESKWKTTSIIK